MQRFYLGIFIIISGLIFSSSLRAEIKEETKDRPYPEFQVDSYVRYIPSRSVEAMEGQVKIVDTGSEYSYALKAFDKLPIKFSLDTRYIGIENSVKDVELPAHLTGLSSDIETTLPFFNFSHTYLRLGASPSFYSDGWDFTASSFRIPSRYFLIYRPNSQWTFLSGVAVYPDFENEVLPIAGFIYKPNHKLTFNIVPKRPNIAYSFNDRVTLFIEGGSAFNNEFEVTRSGSNNVVLRYKERRLGLGIKLTPNQHIQPSLSAGSVFNRSLKYRDGAGKVNIKDGFYAEFRIEIRP